MLADARNMKLKRPYISSQQEFRVPLKPIQSTSWFHLLNRAKKVHEQCPEKIAVSMGAFDQPSDALFLYYEGR